MELSHILFLIIIAITFIMGVSTIPLFIFLMLSHIKLRNYIAVNHLKIIKKRNIEECAGPFHSYDNLLKEIDDPQLKKLHRQAQKIKKYFLSCFAGAAILIMVGMGCSLIFI